MAAQHDRGGLGLFGQRGLTWTRVHWSTDPKYKSPAAYFNFRKYQNLAKIIFNYLFIRKGV
jgi:hypothetical protein